MNGASKAVKATNLPDTPTCATCPSPGIREAARDSDEPTRTQGSVVIETIPPLHSDPTHHAECFRGGLFLALNQDAKHVSTGDDEGGGAWNGEATEQTQKKDRGVGARQSQEPTERLCGVMLPAHQDRADVVGTEAVTSEREPNDNVPIQDGSKIHGIDPDGDIRFLNTNSFCNPKQQHTHRTVFSRLGSDEYYYYHYYNDHKSSAVAPSASPAPLQPQATNNDESVMPSVERGYERCLEESEASDVVTDNALNKSTAALAQKLVELIMASNPHDFFPGVFVDGTSAALARMIQAHDEFRSREQGHVCIGYHYTALENLPGIKAQGLLSKQERESVGITPYKNNGSAHGDGVYVAKDPSAYSRGRYGGVCLLTAILPGDCVDQGSRLASTADSVVVFRDTSHEFIVLKSGHQCIPLLQLSAKAFSLFRPNSRGSQAVYQWHRKLQAILDDFFNNSIVTFVRPFWAMPTKHRQRSFPPLLSMPTNRPLLGDPHKHSLPLLSRKEDEEVFC